MDQPLVIRWGRTAVLRQNTIAVASSPCRANSMLNGPTAFPFISDNVTYAALEVTLDYH
ncbi:MAG TPA: hypothetical protein VJA21_04750 [Verrucomicrobiae bacterium]